MKIPRAIGFEIKRAANLIKRCFDEYELEKDLEGLTGMQGWIIAHIYYNQKAGLDVFQRDLEKDFNIRRSTVTGVLQLMEQNDLIIREPVPSDKRIKCLHLTRRSFQIAEQVGKKIEAVEARLRSGLSDEEVELFFQLIEKIRYNVENDGTTGGHNRHKDKDKDKDKETS